MTRGEPRPPPLARRIAIEAHAAWLAARDPRCPWHARAVGLLVTAYALSPIDLIPDFIPVLGLVDDALLAERGLPKDPTVMLEKGIMQKSIGNQDAYQRMFEQVKAGV